MPTVRPVGEWNAPFIGLLGRREATDESTTERDFRKGSLLPFSASEERATFETNNGPK